MKIQVHPRIKDIQVGDEILCYRSHLFARVEEVFPAAVCVRLVVFSAQRMRLQIAPQLWRAEDIENLSVCRYCGGRQGLLMENASGVPFRVCEICRSVADISLTDSVFSDHLPPLDEA